MLSALMLTGITRLRPQMNSTSGGFGRLLEAEATQGSEQRIERLIEDALAFGLNHLLEGRQPGRDPELLVDRIALVQAFGRIQPNVERDGLLGDRHLLQVAHLSEVALP